MPSLYINIMGILGMFIILVNLVLLEDGKEKAKSIQYLLLGLIGSILLVAYSILTNTLIFTIINFVFVFLNGYWLIIILTGRKIKKKRRRR